MSLPEFIEKQYLDQTYAIRLADSCKSLQVNHPGVKIAPASLDQPANPV
jgi:hypothetical protein